MASTFFMLEAVNLFVGDDAQGKALTLSELKVPDLVEADQDHTGGTGGVTVGWTTHMEKLEATFNLNGYDPDLMRYFGLGGVKPKTFTALGAVRNKRTGKVVEAKSIIGGRLSRIASDAFQRGNLHGHEYAVKEITHYELHFDGEEKFFWDFFDGRRPRIDGQSQDDDVASILQLI